MQNLTIIPVKRRGFTLIEVMVAMTILVVSITALYESYANTLTLLSSNDKLWKSMIFAQNELISWERAESAPVSVTSTAFTPPHPLAGFKWLRNITDETILGATVRMVKYKMNWQDGNILRSYEAAIYIKPSN